MWAHTVQPLKDICGSLVTLNRDGSRAPYKEVIEAWRNDEAFRAFFSGLLASAPFSAFRWETPPATAATIDHPFECVLLEAPGLDRTADPQAFAEHFEASDVADATVVTFSNLGGDAILVVPRPAGPASAYGHLAAFVRHAPAAQQHELWRSVGAAMQTRIGTRPIWLSTAGLGVPWLHVRIDGRPKYYAHRAYAAAP